MDLGSLFLKTEADRRFWTGIARAFGGAIVFALPILMTLEMWTLGPEITEGRLALFLGVTIPILLGMSHFAGFEETVDWREDLLDAFGALAVGFVVSTVVLGMFGMFRPTMALQEWVGMVVLQAIACSLGAMLAVSQFGDPEDEEKKERRRYNNYAGTIFFMGVGAMVLSFSVAPTEEVLLLANQIPGWQLALLGLLALCIVHAFVIAEVRSRDLPASQREPQLKLFARVSVVGYAVALLVSSYVLWTFGRLDGMSLYSAVATAVVLSFPAAIGAGAAHLIF